MDNYRSQRRSFISSGNFQRQQVGENNGNLMNQDMYPPIFNKNINYSENGVHQGNLAPADGNYSMNPNSPMYSPLNPAQPMQNMYSNSGMVSNPDALQNSTFSQLNQYRSFGGNRNSDMASTNSIDNVTVNAGPQSVYNGFKENLIYNNRNVVCEYESSRQLFALDWSVDDYVTLSSYKEDSLNKLQVIHSNDLLTWEKVAECNVTYPVSNIQWLPSVPNPRKLATSSECLRIWSLDDNSMDNSSVFNNNISNNSRHNTYKKSLTEQVNLSLCKYNEQHQIINNSTNSVSNKSNARLLGQLPPVTSFHWNSIDTNLLISSSIDTTCIVWDLQSSNYVKTQLIAHDSEVFDVKFLIQSTQLFASCGGDGSIRVFDLRALQHSTIIYETANDLQGNNTFNNDVTTKIDNSSANSLSHALLRLEPSPTDPNLIATFGLDKKAILILDMRNPGVPVLVLSGHSPSVNQIKWHPSKPYVLLSCGDDCQVLYWDLNSELNPKVTHLARNHMEASNNDANDHIDMNNSKQLNNNGVNSMNGNVDEQNMSSGNSDWKSQNEVKVLTVPSMCYSNKKQEVNNIIWRPQDGEWFGCVAGKKFQNVRLST
ncbi:hypothetical protein TPHA_0D03590 [Tetrapisispora phaffii CBS 4417]|uniref:Anaphase-promoting complex subunit 4 WD40 domain-containing protein n=1 Tax=Tetrapisispora phaffii (strain ATCC 24235 / CBS 4417 / NBRC 1672 / NRRL Y-8282 / UCD 70-5) TaxID=1071381 RepID=G8BT23_TETPH|nr:hypothetical protein TPHA_0D03590 [Tetrapisispora phaffii CBS 4417]CCE62994.1 hypothetical protein TPHA_0D03590 [Tetrapisispora phaffii CBS 4417]